VGVGVCVGVCDDVDVGVDAEVVIDCVVAGGFKLNELFLKFANEFVFDFNLFGQINGVANRLLFVTCVEFESEELDAGDDWPYDKGDVGE
jgi:hypothetical protein